MGLIYGLMKSDKLEREARRTNIEATEMMEKSRQQLNRQKDKTEKALKTLMVRKQGTVNNLKKFKDTFQRILDLGIVVDDATLDSLSNFSLNTLQEYRNLPQIDVNTLSDKQILATFMFHGIGGLMIKDAEIALDVASAKWDTARALVSSNNASIDIYEEVEKLACMQKELISKMNLMFNKSVNTVTMLLDEKGVNLGNYTEYEQQQILVCCKCAKILNAMIQTTLMGQDYQLTAQAKKVFEITENFIAEIRNL